MQGPLYIANLQKGRQKDGITVRVIRKWPVRDNAGQGAIIYIGMVFADAKGSDMYAEIPREAIEEKADLLDVGKIYLIKKFKVSKAKESFMPFHASLMIELSEFTTIELARNPPPTFPQYIYRLTPFSRIVPAGRTVFTYTDVIGYITKYKAVDTFVPHGKEKATILREVYMKDLRDNEMKVTLWGDQAISFSVDNVYDEKSGNVVVFLLLGCIPRRAYDKYDKIVLSAGQACSYYFNPHITEAVPFYNRFRNVPIYIDRPAPSEEQAPVQAVDRPLKQKTIAELNIINPFDFDEGPFKCAVTVTSVVDNTKWWYMACKPCKKKAEHEADGTYRCTKCLGTNIGPRYSLSFTAKDETAQANFFAFDAEATQLVQRDCEAIMNPLTPSHGVPPELQNIVDKSYVFSVDITDDSCKTSKRPRQYLVKSVLQKPTRHRPVPNPAATVTDTPTTAGTTLSIEQAPTSSILIQTPQIEINVPHNQTDTHLTPPPSVDADQHPAKNSEARLDRNVRRSLFGPAGSTQQHNKSDDSDVAMANSTPEQNTTAVDSSLPPKSKRPKNTSTRQSSEHDSHGSASTVPN